MGRSHLRRISAYPELDGASWQHSYGPATCDGCLASGSFDKSIKSETPGCQKRVLFSVKSTFLIARPRNRSGSDRGTAAQFSGNSLESIELPRLDGVRVLVIDDEADGRALTARILEGQGAHTVCATGGAEALDALTRERVDILLSDIGMPDMNGLELIPIRAYYQSRGLPRPSPSCATPEDRAVVDHPPVCRGRNIQHPTSRPASRRDP